MENFNKLGHGLFLVNDFFQSNSTLFTSPAEQYPFIDYFFFTGPTLYYPYILFIFYSFLMQLYYINFNLIHHFRVITIRRHINRLGAAPRTN